MSRDGGLLCNLMKNTSHKNCQDDILLRQTTSHSRYFPIPSPQDRCYTLFPPHKHLFSKTSAEYIKEILTASFVTYTTDKAALFHKYLPLCIISHYKERYKQDASVNLSKYTLTFGIIAFYHYFLR